MENRIPPTSTMCVLGGGVQDIQQYDIEVRPYSLALPACQPACYLDVGHGHDPLQSNANRVALVLSPTHGLATSWHCPEGHHGHHIHGNRRAPCHASVVENDIDHCLQLGSIMVGHFEGGGMATNELTKCKLK